MTTQQPRFTCPTCGERVDPAAEPHALVERIVRSGHRYGVAPGQPIDAPGMPGTRVTVEARHAGHPSVASATMSIEEATASADEVARRAAASPKPGQLARMVEQGLAAARAEIAASVERGRERVRRAVAEAEPPVPPAAPVVDSP